MMRADTLWYDKPAGKREWDRALPLGNGRLGGMVFGGWDCEHIQINEESVWYGGAQNRNNPDARKYLAEIRRSVFSGDVHRAEKLSKAALSGTPYGQGHYEPLGDLLIEAAPTAAPTQYRRELDIGDAVARVQYAADGVTYRREMFVSAVASVMVVRLTADRPESLTVTVHLERGHALEKVEVSAPNSLMLKGTCGGGGTSYRMGLSVLTEDGSVYPVGNRLFVDGASAVTLLIAGRTDYHGEDPEEWCRDTLAAAEKFRIPF